MAALVVAILGAATIWIASRRSWTFTKEVRQYQGRFFRMVVKLDYHGEPAPFDFVVGCNVRSTLWADGGRTREVGIIPAYYGHRMKDGAPNVVTRERLWSYQHSDNVKGMGLDVDNWRMGRDCNYATRWPINEALREKVRDAWPKDRPEESHLIEGLDRHPFRDLQTDDLPEYGMLRRTGLYRIQPTDLQRPDNFPIAAFLPVWRAENARDRPEDRTKIVDHLKSLANTVLQRVLVDSDSWRGFARCENSPRSLAETRLKIPVDVFRSVTGPVAVDDVRADSNGRYIVLGSLVRHIFENDEFVYELSSPNTNIIGGDVK